VIAVAAALLAGCGGDMARWLPSSSDTAFPGGVVGDEPRAVLIGREVLAAGGSAGDAAVAMGFALTATLPSRVSLGGGGLCLVHEPKAMRTESLEFLPRAPAAAPAPGAPAIAVPGFTRGMFALHARLGRLRWEEMVSPGERLARFGFDVTRALARDLPAASAMIAGDTQARAVFADATGAPLASGGRLRQLDLATQLGRIRAEGAGAFYVGTAAQSFVSGVRSLGGSVSVDDLRGYRANWQPTVKAAVGNHVGHFAPQAIGGLAAAELWAILGQGGRWGDARAEDRPHLVAEAVARIGAAEVPLDAQGRIPSAWADRAMAGYDRARHIPATATTGASSDEGRSTGFVVIDRDGGAVACALTAGRMFGVGRIVPSTGIIAAAIPDPATMWSLAPMLVVNVNVKDTILAAVGAGDASAPVALNEVALPVVRNDAPLAAAIEAPRVTYDAANGTTIVESAGDAAAQMLEQRGHRVGRVSALAQVEAIYCEAGARRDGATCSVAADPRGFGLASGVDR
jgi:gamma-glutamyltranspeptidase/glutathione hydrolase